MRKSKDVLLGSKRLKSFDRLSRFGRLANFNTFRFAKGSIQKSIKIGARPKGVVGIGDDVTATRRTIPRNLNRSELTLRTDDSDPLKESVSSLLPLEGEALANMMWEPLEDMIPELNAIIENLLLQERVEDVQTRRQAEVQHKVSKDLELWLSKEEVEDGFNLVARSGRTLQEINVCTDFSRDEMKSVLEQVLRQAM